MKSLIFENIDYNKSYQAKVFITSLETSVFHWHYDYEIILVLKGSLLVNSGPEQNLLRAGDIILVNNKTIHGMQNTGESNLCLFIQISPKLFDYVLGDRQSYYFYMNSVNGSFVSKVPYAYFVKVAAQIGMSSQHRTPLGELRTHALIRGLLADLVEFAQYDIRQQPLLQMDHSSKNLMIRISEYIEQHLNDSNLSTDVCEMMGMSEKTMYRFLKNSLSLTLKEVITYIRVEKAKMLLNSCEMPVANIIAECGFASEMTFYRTFKKHLGVTPNEYRQNGAEPATKFVNPSVQGYLSFDRGEARFLLQNFADLT